MRYFSLGLLALALGVEVAAHPASADEEAANQAEEIAHYNANHVDDYQDDYAEEMRKDGIDPEQQVFPDQGLAKPADDDDWWSEYQALFAEYGQEFSLNTEIFRDLKEDPEFLADDKLEVFGPTPEELAALEAIAKSAAAHSSGP